MKVSANWPLGSEDISGKWRGFFQKASSVRGLGVAEQTCLFPTVTYASLPQALLLTEDAETPSFLSTLTAPVWLVAKSVLTMNVNFLAYLVIKG